MKTNRNIIVIDDRGNVTIPNKDVWMNEMELVELFGVTAPTLRTTIKDVYKRCGCNIGKEQRCDVVPNVGWATYYNLEMVIALAFRLDTCEADRLRQVVVSRLCERKENNINLVYSLQSMSKCTC